MLELVYALVVLLPSFSGFLLYVSRQLVGVRAAIREFQNELAVVLKEHKKVVDSLTAAFLVSNHTPGIALEDREEIWVSSVDGNPRDSLALSRAADTQQRMSDVLTVAGIPHDRGARIHPNGVKGKGVALAQRVEPTSPAVATDGPLLTLHLWVPNEHAAKARSLVGEVVDAQATRQQWEGVHGLRMPMLPNPEDR